MNIPSLFALIFAFIAILNEKYKDSSLRLVVFTTTLILTFIPFCFGLYELFTSPRSIRKRILMSFYKMVFSDDNENRQFKKKLNGESLYCNPFSVESVNCKHNYLIRFCDRSVDGIQLWSQEWEKEMLTIDYDTKDGAKEANDVWMAFSGRSGNEDGDNELEIGYLNKKMILHLLQNVKQNGVINYRINFPDTSLTLKFDIKKSVAEIFVTYNKIGLGKPFRSECSCYDFMRMIDAFIFMKARDRDCCFLTKGVNKVRQGYRIHCLNFEEILEGFSKGKGIEYYKGGDLKKYSEGEVLGEIKNRNHLDLLKARYGELGNVIMEYVTKYYSELGMSVFNYIGFGKTTKNPSRSGLKNWKSRRCFVDVSYILESFGLPHLKGTGYGVNPTLKVQSFLKNKNYQFEANKEDKIAPLQKISIKDSKYLGEIIKSDTKSETRENGRIIQAITRPDKNKIGYRNNNFTYTDFSDFKFLTKKRCKSNKEEYVNALYSTYKTALLKEKQKGAGDDDSKMMKDKDKSGKKNRNINIGESAYKRTENSKLIGSVLAVAKGLEVSMNTLDNDKIKGICEWITVKRKVKFRETKESIFEGEKTFESENFYNILRDIKVIKVLSEKVEERSLNDKGKNNKGKNVKGGKQKQKKGGIDFNILLSPFKMYMGEQSNVEAKVIEKDMNLTELIESEVNNARDLSKKVVANLSRFKETVGTNKNLNLKPGFLNKVDILKNSDKKSFTSKIHKSMDSEINFSRKLKEREEMEEKKRKDKEMILKKEKEKEIRLNEKWEEKIRIEKETARIMKETELLERQKFYKQMEGRKKKISSIDDNEVLSIEQINMNFKRLKREGKADEAKQFKEKKMALLKQSKESGSKM